MFCVTIRTDTYETLRNTVHTIWKALKTMKKDKTPEQMSLKSDEGLVNLTEQGDPEYPVDTFTVNLNETYSRYVRWHWHNQIEISVVLKGKAVFYVNDRHFELSEGQGIFINQNVMHSIRLYEEEPCVFRTIVFDVNFILDTTNKRLSIEYLKPIIENPGFFCLVFDGNEEFHDNLYKNAKLAFEANISKEYGYELETRKYLTNFWIITIKHIKDMQLKASKSINQHAIDEARTKAGILYIQSHYASPITLDEIAAAANISRGECCRCFNRIVHMSPFEYLMQYRILMAVNIMTRPPLIPMSKLAETVGFNSNSYFNKVFKRILKCTPTQYRKNFVGNIREKD